MQISRYFIYLISQVTVGQQPIDFPENIFYNLLKLKSDQKTNAVKRWNSVVAKKKSIGNVHIPDTQFYEGSVPDFQVSAESIIDRKIKLSTTPEEFF